MVDLYVPEIIVEGDTFIPRIVVSQEVVAEFLVYISDGTAISSADYRFTPELVQFGPTNTVLSTDSSVVTVSDGDEEPDETFILNIQLVSPLSLKPFLKINNPSEVITIVDNNSECR